MSTLLFRGLFDDLNKLDKENMKIGKKLYAIIAIIWLLELSSMEPRLTERISSYYIQRQPRFLAAGSSKISKQTIEIQFLESFTKLLKRNSSKFQMVYLIVRHSIQYRHAKKIKIKKYKIVMITLVIYVYRALIY